MTVRAAASIAVAFAVLGAATARPEDPDPRRTRIASLGRLAWSGYDSPVAFCDLDGSNVVESKAVRADWLRWLPDGRRVVATSGDHVFVVDSTTGATTDLAADAKYGERFVSDRPALSPDGRRLVMWHTVQPTGGNRSVKSYVLGTQVVGYTLFDLDAGTRAELAPAPVPDLARDPPIVAWSADSKTLYAAIGTEPQRLTRFDADGAHPEIVATLAPGDRIQQIALRDAKIVLAVGHGRGFDVREAGGKSLFALDRGLRCSGLAWDRDGAALVVNADAPHTGGAAERWRVEPGKPPEKLRDPYPSRRTPTGDPAWEIEARRAEDATLPTMWLVPVPSGEPIRLDTTGPVVRVGGAFVFWRTTTPSKWSGTGAVQRFTPSVDDLWAYDPEFAAEIRLTDRGFSPRCWDVRPATPASRGR